MLTKEEKLSRLKLVRSPSIGATTFWSMIKTYGSGIRSLNAIPILAKASGKSIELCSEKKIEEELRNLKTIGARLVFFEDELYPPLLRNIPDAPPVLTFLGDKKTALQFYRKNLLSVVGSRNCSIHAEKLCSSLCKDLGKKDVIVISGLARGIDTSAHRNSIQTGTIAILAGGIDIVYPPENIELYNAIKESGCLFSEMPIGTSPQPQLFPRRNRIIAGMTYGTLVIEAAQNSGSLITAKMALEYNREVFGRIQG